MSTEEKLREAIGALTCRVGPDHAGCWCLHAPGVDGADEGHDEGCLAARAALALQPSEAREEFRVVFLMGGRREIAADTLASALDLAECLDGKVIIESRTAAYSPWAEVPAGIPPSPQAECAALIGQVMDKLIDAAQATICAFQGSKDGLCDLCGKSWMAPDHQAPMFDPRTPR